MEKQKQNMYLFIYLSKCTALLHLQSNFKILRFNVSECQCFFDFKELFTEERLERKGIEEDNQSSYNCD